MFDWLEPSFMKRAFFVVVLIFPLFGLLGSAVVAGRMVFFSDALAHGAFVGMALSLVLGVNIPQWLTVLLFSIIFAVVVALVRFHNRSSSDTVIGVFSSFSVAVGILILSRVGNFSQYSHILIGDILTVSWRELLWAFILGCFILLLWGWQSNSNFLCQLSEGVARSYGVNPLFSTIIFTVTLAILVSFSVNWLGVFLLNALLVLPAASSRMIAKNFLSYHYLAVLISFMSGVLGLISSYYFNLNTSASIAVVCSVFYFVFLLCCRNRQKKRQQKRSLKFYKVI